MATPDLIREHYDSFAWIYRTFWGDHIHHGLFLRGDELPEEAQINLLDHCARLSDVRPGLRVLDVGCGHGGTSVYLARRFNCQIEGLTLSPKQVRLAKESARRAGVETLTRFLVADAETHAFPNDVVDLVWTMESSEHFQDKPHYFRRAARSLRPGGRLMLAAWTGSMENRRVRTVADAFLCPSLQTAQDYQRQIEGAGLRMRGSEDISKRVMRTWEICLERSRKLQGLIRIFPREVRSFVEGIRVILDAYRSGDLTYSLIVAEKCGSFETDGLPRFEGPFSSRSCASGATRASLSPCLDRERQGMVRPKTDISRTAMLPPKSGLVAPWMWLSMGIKSGPSGGRACSAV